MVAASALICSHALRMFHFPLPDPIEVPTPIGEVIRSKMNCEAPDSFVIVT